MFNKKKLYKIRYKILSNYVYTEIVSAKNIHKALKIFRELIPSCNDILSIEEYKK